MQSQPIEKRFEQVLKKNRLKNNDHDQDDDKRENKHRQIVLGIHGFETHIIFQPSKTVKNTLANDYTYMAEKPKKKKKKKPPVSLGTLLLVAIGGRLLFNSFALQIASVEPVLPTAILPGIYFGAGPAILVGIMGYALSNLFLGSLGGWTIWQGLSGAIAGYIGATSNRDNYIMNVIIATVIFEVIMNFTGARYTVDSAYFFGSLGYSITHVVANIFFAVLFKSLWLKEE